MGILKVNGDIESNYNGSVSIKMTNGSLNTSINTSGGWARGWYITLNGTSVGPLIGGHGSGSNNSMSRIYFGNYDNPWMKIEPTGTVTATKFVGSLQGNADTASLLSIHNSLTNTSTRSTAASSWNGSVSGLQYVWGQSFKDTSIGSDTGDLVLGLRAGEYTSGGTELCMMIDGDYYSLGKKVLHAGNYTDYTVTKTGSGASGTWGINITGNSSYADGSNYTYRLNGRGVTTNITTAATPGAMEYDYNVLSDTPGLFPVWHNANAILTLNKHYGGYDSQLGFSSNGRLYYRSFSGYVLDATTGWNTIAWTSDLSGYLPLSGGTLTGVTTISYAHTGGGMLQLSSTDNNESSIGYNSGGTPYWVVGKGCGGTGNNTFAWWHNPSGKNMMTLNSSGNLHLAGSTISFGGSMTQNTSPTVVATYVSNNSANGLGFAYTSNLSVGYANTAGWASSAGDAGTLNGWYASGFIRKHGWWTNGNTSYHADTTEDGIVFAYTMHGVPSNWGTLCTFGYGNGRDYNLQLHGTGSNQLFFRNRSSDYGQGSWQRVQVVAGWGSTNPNSAGIRGTNTGDVYYVY